MAQHLFSVHDFDPTWAAWVRDAGVSAWCVTSFAMGERTHPSFDAMAAHRVTPIARLNWSHHGQGTIPPGAADDGNFAAWCGKFANASPSCKHFIIGNEPNWSVEWGGGPPITPGRYAACYLRAHDAIKAVRPDAIVMPAAIAPWNVESGMGWVEYFAEMLTALHGNYDAINLHTYSRGYMPAAVTSEDRMDAPWQQYRNGFRTYRDFLAAVPTGRRHLPVHITETNGNGVWPSDRSGWVQAAYAEIDAWNQTDGTQKVHSLTLFRWPKFDAHWQFETKTGVHADFRDALKAAYRAPDVTPPTPATAPATTIHLPAITAGGTPTPTPTPTPDREWDARLDARGVTISPADAQPGDRYWRLVRGEYLDERESGGRHHIFVDTLDEAGNRVPGVGVRFAWDGGRHIAVTEAKPGEPHAVDYPMYAAGHGYMCHVADGPSDIVAGMGLGSIEQPHMGIHVSYRMTFQRVTANGSQSPKPELQPEPEPPTPPVDPGHIDPRVLQAILQVESGGRAFGPDGRMIIRLENHILAPRVPAAWYAAHFRHGSPGHTGHAWRPSAQAEWRTQHTGRQADEWDPFLFASQFYPEQAAQSISMGSAQIMGFNHIRVGYPSARAMFDALGDRTQGETTQMIAFFAFLLNTTGMLTAIRRKDWREIARMYNGVGQVDLYAGLLEAAYRKLTGG